MGDAFGEGRSEELPVHCVYVSGFYMARCEVTKALWDEVRAWGPSHGYTDLARGGGKGPAHPVHSITWYDMVKWCNARSQEEGLTPCYRVSGVVYRTGDSDAVTCDWSANGYRLPTHAEWEKAARGGLLGKRFPWGDTINHSHANYRAHGSAYSYDTSPYTEPTCHPAYNDGVLPYTAPVGSFAPNGFGLYDMVGNVFEFCWDWIGLDYLTSPYADPRGPLEPGPWHDHVCLGGGYNGQPSNLRCAAYSGQGYVGDDLGFRLARAVISGGQ